MRDKPIHFQDAAKLFSVYRAAKGVVDNTDLTKPQILRPGQTIEDVKENYKQSVRVVRIVHKAISDIRTCVDGDKIAGVLYLRYINKKPLTEADIIAKLDAEGIAKTRQTYYRLREKGICYACAFLWGDDFPVETIKDIKLPEGVDNI